MYVQDVGKRHRAKLSNGGVLVDAAMQASQMLRAARIARLACCIGGLCSSSIQEHCSTALKVEAPWPKLLEHM